MDQSSDSQAPEHQRARPARVVKWWRRWLVLGVAFFVITVITGLVNNDKNDKKNTGEVPALHDRINRFNESVRNGLDSVQPLSPLRSFGERLGDDYHWSVLSWQAPFNVTRKRQQYQDELHRAFKHDAALATLKTQEPAPPPQPQFQGSLAVDQVTNPNSPRLEAWMKAQEKYRAEYPVYERQQAAWQLAYDTRKQHIQRALASKYPKIVVDQSASSGLPKALRAILFGIPDATGYMVQQAWARNWFSRLVLFLVPALVMLGVADDWRNSKLKGLFPTLETILGLTIMALLAVSIGATAILVVLSMFTGSVLSLAAVIVGICALPASISITHVLITSGADLLKEFVADRLLSGRTEVDRDSRR